MGNCNELGGAPFLTIPEHSLVTLRKLFVNRGDMKVMGRPPGVVVSASCSSAFKSSSRLISRSAVCSALATGLACPTDEDMPSSFLTATSVAPIRLNLGVGSLGDANTSLKLMLMGVSGAPPTARGLCLFFPDFFEASGEMQIMLRWLSGILGVLTPTSPPASNSAKKRSWWLLDEGANFNGDLGGPNPLTCPWPTGLFPGGPQKPYIPRGVLVTDRELRPPPGEKRPWPPGDWSHANTLLTSSAFKLFSFVCPLPKSLAKFVGVRPGVNPGVMPEVFVTFSKRVMNLGVRGERNMPGESLLRSKPLEAG
mmetsp:Transcript_35366/g.63727  ORF Transcript_35366/g.63727 Transcript_35366/m.63727 type:complete len:310 (+) Transcript_35366:1306-2235(+)